MPLSTVLSQASNGNGHAVNGRGLRHRKMSRNETLQMAAEIAVGHRPFMPALHHLAGIFDLSVAALGKAVKAYEASEKEAVKVDLPADLPTRGTSSEPSALTQAWYSASLAERQRFLCEEIVSRVIR